MTDLAFEPTLISLHTGDTARIEFDNRAAEMHDFTVDRVSVSDVRTRGEVEHDMMNMGTKTQSLHLAVAGGKTARIDFRPTEAGDYEFYCTVAGHREAGIRGTIHVE